MCSSDLNRHRVCGVGLLVELLPRRELRRGVGANRADHGGSVTGLHARAPDGGGRGGERQRVVHARTVVQRRAKQQRKVGLGRAGGGAGARRAAAFVSTLVVGS